MGIKPCNREEKIESRLTVNHVGDVASGIDAAYVFGVRWVRVVTEQES